MSKFSSILPGVLSLALLVVLGCTKPYIITNELSVPLDKNGSCSIGAVIDELPADFEADDKPTIETIEKFKTFLYEELDDKELFSVLRQDLLDANYEVTGSILDYKKGSGFLRFLFGAWAGSAKVVVSLNLTDVETGEVLFAGNFTGTVTSWAEGGEMMFKRVAKDFAKQLRKQIEELEKASAG